MPDREITELKVIPVGVVRSDLKDLTLSHKDGELAVLPGSGGRQGGKGDISELVLYKEYEECLEGIEEFSHVIVIFWSHIGDEEGRGIKQVHPGGRKTIPPVGVFATRSPARPNPICISAVELLGRLGNVVTVRGLDAVDGSPILDIKPPNPVYDVPADAKLAGWMERLIEEHHAGSRPLHFAQQETAFRAQDPGDLSSGPGR